MRLNVKNFALAGGIYGALCVAAVTIAALLNVPGFPEFTSFLETFYGSWGYSTSFAGIFIGALWGFVEGFIHLGVFASIYNKLTRK